MKLYELSQNYNNLYDLLNNEEVPVEVIEDALKEIEDEIEIKFENIAKLIRSIEGTTEVIRAEERRLANRRRVMENKVKSLKNYMLDQLNVMDRTRIEANIFVVRKQRNPKSVEVVDKKQLDKKYLIDQEPKVDNRAIKADLDLGREVAGAKYKPESYHIRIQ